MWCVLDAKKYSNTYEEEQFDTSTNKSRVNKENSTHQNKELYPNAFSTERKTEVDNDLLKSDYC